MTPEEATSLRRPFPPESVGRLPKGGQMLDYVGHAAVTDRLLTVDPEWSWEPFSVTPEGLPALDRGGNLWIRLTICGVTRIGVGDGKSAKECIGDAIRNAAMRFGVALDLWAKEDLVEFAQAARHPRPTPEAVAGVVLARRQCSAAGAHPAHEWGKSDATGSHQFTCQGIATPEAAADSPPIKAQHDEPDRSGSVTRPQIARMHAAFNGVGITDRAERLAYTAQAIGRQVETSNDLTKAEAGKLLDALKAHADELGGAA